MNGGRGVMVTGNATRRKAMTSKDMFSGAAAMGVWIACVVCGEGCAVRDKAAADGASGVTRSTVPESATGHSGVDGQPQRYEVRRTSLTFSEGESVFQAVLEVPSCAERPRAGVLMIGGGTGNDLDWTTPGELEVDGQRVRVTISGRPHADGAAISRALAERGVAVLRWSTIAVGDPLADQWPEKSTPRSAEELMGQARAALRAFRGLRVVDADRVIVVGHSLGAARACTLAAEDEGIAGLVLLSPAYFVRGERVPRAFAANGPDGKAVMRFGIEVLRERRVACLALYGGLDRSPVVDAAAGMKAAASGEMPVFTAETVAGVGHQLGEERDGLLGPIDEAVLGRIVAWVREHGGAR